MKKTTFVIDEFYIIEVVYEKEIKEFKEYLLSLKGVVSARVSNEDVITIDVCYDEELITDNIIYMEISTFLNILKITIQDMREKMKFLPSLDIWIYKI